MAPDRSENDLDQSLSLSANIGKRAGLLGGTFDPVHNGHLAAATAVRDYLHLDSIVFIPAADPPHKQEHVITPFFDRLAMLQLAISGYPDFFVSTVEAQRQGPSYTIDTVRQLRRGLPREVALFFIIGTDAFVELATWKNYEQLLAEVNFAVIERLPSQNDPKDLFAGHWQRPGFDNEENAWTRAHRQGRIYSVRMEPVAVSSTMIRQRARAGQSIGPLVPAVVEEYIVRNRLYR